MYAPGLYILSMEFRLHRIIYRASTLTSGWFSCRDLDADNRARQIPGLLPGQFQILGNLHCYRIISQELGRISGLSKNLGVLESCCTDAFKVFLFGSGTSDTSNVSGHRISDLIRQFFPATQYQRPSTAHLASVPEKLLEGLFSCLVRD